MVRSFLRSQTGVVSNSHCFVEVSPRYIRLYSFIEITSDIPHMFTIKVQVIRNTAHRPSTQASYTIGSGTTMQEN